MRVKNPRNVILIGILTVVAAVCVALAFVTSALNAHADGVVVEGEGDNFMLTETSYGADERSKWVFNVDREANRVKLMHFSDDVADVIREDWFIGNGKMTEGEKSLVNPKVASARWVQLKVVVTPEDDKVYAEFYADNIRRFAFDDRGEDVTIDLNALREELTYTGGSTGFNCFNASVTFTDIYTGVSDYSYYTELYRQQYHFSQYAHWNNDPNGLVYYNGWYHLYYQTHPFSNYWSDMYWGHARSRDLVHWQHLPICLFPDTDFDGREKDGYMWSGSAMVYHAGDSAAVDALNW